MKLITFEQSQAVKTIALINYLNQPVVNFNHRSNKMTLIHSTLNGN